jgi:hypothetical protein
VRLTIGQVFPEWDGRALNVSWKAVMTVMDGLTDAPPAVRDEIAAWAADGGEAVRLLLERARRSRPARRRSLTWRSSIPSRTSPKRPAKAPGLARRCCCEGC